MQGKHLLDQLLDLGEGWEVKDIEIIGLFIKRCG